MCKDKILKKVSMIVDSNNGVQEIEDRLHDLERKYKHFLFIKTYLCANCHTLNVDVWFKIKTINTHGKDGV